MKKLIEVAVATFLGLCLNSAYAGLITLNDIATQTIDGQNFNFNFNGLAQSDGTGGSFILHAAGDYDGRDDETLSWNIDGLVGVGAVGGFCSTGITSVCTSGGGATTSGGQGGVFDSVTVGQPLGQVEWTRTYSLNGALLDSILADGMAGIFIDLDDNVDASFNPPRFVEVTLKYNSRVSVSEPSILALLGLGLAGIAFSRKNRI